MNVRFPKLGDPIIETTKSERKTLHDATRILRHLAMITKEQSLVKAADEIEAFLAEQEAVTVPVIG